MERKGAAWATLLWMYDGRTSLDFLQGMGCALGWDEFVCIPRRFVNISLVGWMLLDSIWSYHYYRGEVLLEPLCLNKWKNHQIDGYLD